MTLPKIQYPLFEIEIPSSKKKIKIRPYLVKEEKLLLFAKQSGEQNDMLSAIKQIVTNCVIDKIDVDKLAIFDLEYIFMKLRAVSVNNMAKVSYKDNEDEKVYDFEIDLDKVTVKFPEKDNKVIQINDQYSLLMKFPEAAIYADNDPGPKETLSFYLDKTISKIMEGDQMTDWSMATPQERAEFIDHLPAKTLEAVQDFWNNMPKLEHKLTYQNKLGHDREIVLTRLQDFFTF